MGVYPTSKLRAGTTVKVLRPMTDQGWLEIEPPAGSFSWVNTKFLTQDTKDPRIWRVKADSSAGILPGSSVEGAGRPNREIMQLAGGTIVIAVNAKVDLDGQSWLPIMPHVGEPRYIPATAVKDLTAVAKVNTPASWILTPQNMYTTDPALAEAQKREAANDRAGALQAYQQVVNNPNSDANSLSLAQKAIARLSQPGYTAVQGTTTSLSPGNPRAKAAVKLETWKAPAWSDYGRLYQTKMTTIDGQPLYSLQDANGRVLTYVSIAAGKSLNDYIGRWISVYGPTMHRPDSQSEMAYILATHVASP